MLASLLAEGKTHEEIAAALKTTHLRVKNRICWDNMTAAQRAAKREGTQRRRLQKNEPSVPLPTRRPCERLMQERDERLYSPRTITAMIFGDPAPGYSALDRKREEASR